FFMESIFIGAIIYGFGKLSKRTLYICSIFLAVGTMLSAFFIIVANSW
ncbi:cytochrome ubiquinol oxidase subunit I, partial [Candidatus Micrarchaeota archaeon CG10_big_fil_rev_8_21_14_0_10_59_7]